jgi:hypothetical protein
VTAPQRAAARLLRFYPRAWRARYGEEFTELLLAEFADRPRCWRRTADVIRAALLARLASAGLTGRALDPADQIRASLATLSCALVAFATFGVAIWSQLTTSGQWATPHDPGTRVAIVLMSLGVPLFTLLVLLAGAPVLYVLARSLTRRGIGELAWPAALTVLGATVLAVGSHQVENGWPGTGGGAAAVHPGLMPAGVAAFGWAATLWVSSYWAHPHALGSFPAGQLAWMALSPLAWLCLAVGGTWLVRRLRLPARLFGFEARLAAVVAVTMAVFAVGAACWVFGTGAGSSGLFHAGAVDVAAPAVMLLAATAGARAAATALQARVALNGCH